MNGATAHLPHHCVIRMSTHDDIRDRYNAALSIESRTVEDMACECSHQGTPPPPDYRQPERHLLIWKGMPPLSSLPFSFLSRASPPPLASTIRPRATFSTAASVNVRLPPRLSRRLYACRQAPSWASSLVSGARRAPLPRGCEGVRTPSRCRRLIWRRVTSRLAKGYWAHQTL